MGEGRMHCRGGRRFAAMPQQERHHGALGSAHACVHLHNLTVDTGPSTASFLDRSTPTSSAASCGSRSNTASGRRGCSLHGGGGEGTGTG